MAGREKWPKSLNMLSAPVTHRMMPPRLIHAGLPSSTKYLQSQALQLAAHCHNKRTLAAELTPH